MSKFIKILFSSLSIYAIVLFLGAYLTLNYEIQNPDSNIKSYYDALWWSLNATSIGDSNVYPITVQGRIVGAFLIVIGYGLFTVNVATISAGLSHITRSNKSFEEKIEKLLKKGNKK